MIKREVNYTANNGNKEETSVFGNIVYSISSGQNMGCKLHSYRKEVFIFIPFHSIIVFLILVVSFSKARVML